MVLDEYEEELAEHSEYVVRTLSRRGFSRQDVEDAVQDVYIKLLNLDIEIPHSKLRSFLYTSAMRLCINKYKRNAKYSEIVEQMKLELSSESEALPDDEAQERVAERIDLMKVAMRQLSDVERQIIQLHIYEGMKVREIAAELGYSDSKVKMTLSRARKTLKTEMNKMENENGTY